MNLEPHEAALLRAEAFDQHDRPVAIDGVTNWKRRTAHRSGRTSRRTIRSRRRSARSGLAARDDSGRVTRDCRCEPLAFACDVDGDNNGALLAPPVTLRNLYAVGTLANPPITAGTLTVQNCAETRVEWELRCSIPDPRASR